MLLIIVKLRFLEEYQSNTKNRISISLFGPTAGACPLVELGLGVSAVVVVV